jgi:outer membrane protein TolC
LERLGPLPEIGVRKNLSFETSYFRPLRNGVGVGGKLRLEGAEQSFLDKLQDPIFGGLEVPNRFPSSLSFLVDVPLARGRGAIAAAAPERSAEFVSRAQQSFLRHALSEETFRTVLAYFNLVAAQESLQLLEDSAARQQDVVQLTQQLVDGGEVAAAELVRAQARAASVESSVRSGRLSLLVARFSLAQTIGLEVETQANAPLATDGFNAVLDEVSDVEALVTGALADRRDSRALRYLLEASETLADAARVNLKPMLDLSLTAGMNTLYQSPFMSFLPDELDPIVSDLEPAPERDSPVHFYSPRGPLRGFGSEWQPFAMVSLTFELPFGNNVAKGRLLQAQSSVSRSRIDTANLERVIRDNVVDITGALRFAARAVEQHRSAVGFYEQTLEAALQRFEAGEITLVDVLVSEEDLTTERVQLVRALQAFVSTLARLNFETGDLVRFENEGAPSEMIVFDPGAFVGE